MQYDLLDLCFMSDKSASFFNFYKLVQFLVHFFSKNMVYTLLLYPVNHLISHLHKILVSDWLMNYESFLNTVQLINSTCAISTHPGTLHVDLVSFHRNTHILCRCDIKRKYQLCSRRINEKYRLYLMKVNEYVRYFSLILLEQWYFLY